MIPTIEQPFGRPSAVGDASPASDRRRRGYQVLYDSSLALLSFSLVIQAIRRPWRTLYGVFPLSRHM